MKDVHPQTIEFILTYDCRFGTKVYSLEQARKKCPMCYPRKCGIKRVIKRITSYVDITSLIIDRKKGK